MSSGFSQREKPELTVYNERKDIQSVNKIKENTTKQMMALPKVLKSAKNAVISE